jgi:HSP20 family protein
VTWLRTSAIRKHQLLSGGRVMATEAKPEGRGMEKAQAQPVHALTPFEEMERLFDAFSHRSWMRPWRFDWPALPEAILPLNGRFPRVDVIDDETEVVVRAEVPGVEKKDIDISVGEDSVTIKGSTRHEEKESKGDYYRHELSTGAFSRTVGLPAAVDGTKAKAEFKDGILELTLPKVEKAKRHSVRIP